jgi:hypothetical protein
MQTSQPPILSTHPYLHPLPHPSHLLAHYLRSDDSVRAGHADANSVSAVSASTTAARRALLPRDMELLGKSDGGIVVGELTASLAVLASKRNTVVDVEDAVAAAGGPDGGSGLDAVLLRVNLAGCESAAACEGGASSLLRNCVSVDVRGSEDIRGRVRISISRDPLEVEGGSLTHSLSSVLGEVVSRNEAACNSGV